MFADRHDALSRWLTAHRDLWHPRPFAERALAWEAAHPEVAAWLDALPDDAVSPGVAPDLALGPEPLATWAREAAAHAALPDLPAMPFALQPRAARGLPGRKQAQIAAFVGAALRSAPSGDHVLDWCAGKGHLGRTLAGALGRPLVAVEWDAALCDAGRALCDAQKQPATFHTLDARGPEAAALVGPDARAVALHACGDLHGALLRAAVTHGVAALAVAPCCYNRAVPAESAVLSAGGRASGLSPDADDLDLVHRAPVVTGPAGRARLAQTLAWRLGFDLWQRAAMGEDTYRRMPPFPETWLALDFAEFARRFAALGALSTAPGAEITAFEKAGHARLRSVVRRDAVRGLFARPLEVWLLLDRARLLEEAGLEVHLGCFCPETATPRNALLLARRA